MFILHIIKLCVLVMHMTISFTLDIYTTTFIVANYYSIDWYFEYVYNCQLYKFLDIIVIHSCWMNAREVISRVIHVLTGSKMVGGRRCNFALYILIW